MLYHIMDARLGAVSTYMVVFSGIPYLLLVLDKLAAFSVIDEWVVSFALKACFYVVSMCELSRLRFVLLLACVESRMRA